MTAVTPETAKEVAELAYVIGSTFLYGKPPEFQSAVLADLVATWLAGYQGEQKDEARKTLFDMWSAHVWRLVPVNEQMILERYVKEHAGDTKQ